MGYVGNQTTNSFTSMAKQDITGNGGANYTLSHAVANEQEIEVFVNNVRQEGGVGKAYTVSGTALTMTGNVASSDEFYVVFQGKAVGTIVPADGSVGTVKLSDGAVGTAKLADGSVTATKLASTLDLSSKALTMPTGSIIQVKYTQFTGTNQVTSSANTDTVVTDLTVDISPRATNSIIKIDAMVNGEWEIQTAAIESTWLFFRDSTALKAPAAGNRNRGILMGTSLGYYLNDADSTPEQAYYSYFDSPNSTSQITYKVAFNSINGRTWSLNRTVGDSDDPSYERGISFISVTEIAG